MTVVEITTGSKSEAAAFAAKHGGEVQRAGPWQWKVTFRLGADVDLDNLAVQAREMGCDVAWT